MHRSRRLTLVTVAAAIVAAGVTAWLPAQTSKEKLCCIGGTYTGFNSASALPKCPPPTREKFTMTVRQSLGCGATVRGTITGASGDVNTYTGTLSAGLRGCCVLTASFSDAHHPGHAVNFKGTFCKGTDGKWHAKGTFTEVGSGDPCKTGGTWEANQS